MRVVRRAACSFFGHTYEKKVTSIFADRVKETFVCSRCGLSYTIQSKREKQSVTEEIIARKEGENHVKFSRRMRKMPATSNSYT